MRSITPLLPQLSGPRLESAKGPHGEALRARETKRRPSPARGTEHVSTLELPIRATDGAHVWAHVLAQYLPPEVCCRKAHAAGDGMASLRAGLAGSLAGLVVHVRRSVDVIVGRLRAATVVESA